MPIEFRCSQCGKLLRTGDETAGRQAQCPGCGALTQVPSLATTPETPPLLEPLGIQTSGAPGNPFGPGPQAGGATGAYYVPPAQRVSGPATALIVTAILGIIGQAIGILANLIQMAIGAGVAAQGPEALPLMLGSGINLALGIFGLAMGVLVLMGAMKMKKLENYSFAMASAIIALIPCVSPCCLLGLPFGIWALVVLGDSSVKAAFRS